MSSAYSHKTVNTFVLGNILVFGIIELAVVYRFFPKSYTSYMLLNPVYFFLLGLTVLLAVSRIESKRLHPGRAVARLMLLNTSQFILSACLLFYYVYRIHVQCRAFLLTFGLFYIWFMCVKLFVLYNIDSQHKHHKRTRTPKDEKKV